MTIKLTEEQEALLKNYGEIHVTADGKEFVSLPQVFEKVNPGGEYRVLMLGKPIESLITMYTALVEISKGMGRYDEDMLKHANNTIEDMRELAMDAIAKVRKGGI